MGGVWEMVLTFTLSTLLLCNYGMARQFGRLEVLWVHG